MEKYNKQQRNEFYINAYNRFCEQPFCGICFALYESNNELTKYSYSRKDDEYGFSEILPEFALFDPKQKEEGYWFEGYNADNERLTALAFMIAMTES